jgi:CheY-like chemotaxis protein
VWHLVLIDGSVALATSPNVATDTLARVRRLLPEPAILVMSSDPSPERVERALHSGANGYVLKPLTLERVKLLWQHCMLVCAPKSSPVTVLTHGSSMRGRPVASHWTSRALVGGGAPAAPSASESYRQLGKLQRSLDVAPRTLELAAATQVGAATARPQPPTWAPPRVAQMPSPSYDADRESNTPSPWSSSSDQPSKQDEDATEDPVACRPQ